ncbi:MAG: box helicase [Bacteroidota bacterium]|jgi:ATP-dependent RNA helicase RhlE|nr:box helicase [Bacteroidota bacterium]
MKFEDYQIIPALKQSLTELGFKRPTDIQFKAIPNILKGEDVLAIAQTGTGKTAAFAIPIIHLIEQAGTGRGVQAIVMVPTHELAIQITEVFDKLAKYTSVKTLGIFGGVDQDPQIDQLHQGVEVVIATPGRVFDLVYQKHLNLRDIKVLVLDEADLMLDLGFYKDIEDLIKYLPRRRQTLFFSATINEKIKKLAYSLVHNAIRIQISPKDPVSKNVSHSVMFVSMDDKRFFLERIVKENPDSRILVFVRTKVRTERVFEAMNRVGIKSQTMHGGKDQDSRLEVMNGFKQGDFKILIATDISARGVDIANVDYVVNYDLPEVAENYVHRVGRTGRGNQKGVAVSFCSPEEKPILSEIESYMDKKITVLEVKKADYSETLALTEDVNDNWRKLIADAEKEDQHYKGKKKKKR